MGIYGYNCYNFCHDNDFGGSNYISGTTCDGVVGAYTLNFGDCICMDIDQPLITCDNPIFSGECFRVTPSVTATNTQTPSVTPSVTQTNTPTNTSTQTNTPTMTPTTTPTPTLICLEGSGLTATSVAKVVTSGSTAYIGAFAASQYNSTPISNFFGINQYGTLTLSAVNFDSQVTDILPQSDGKFMVVGGFTLVDGVSRSEIARLNSDGTLDTSFVVGTGFSGVGTPVSVAINSSGDYYVGGQFVSYSGVSSNNIIKLTSTGSVDNTFNVGTGTNDIVNSVLVQNDGKVILAGFFTSYSSTTRNRIVRLNTDGTIDNTFSIGTGFNNSVFQAVLQPDGKVICVGGFTTYSGISANRVARLNTDGTLDNTFTSLGFNGQVNDIALDVDGNIIVTGQFTTYNGISQSRIVKLNPDGTLFASWNSGGGAGPSIFSVATFSNKRILLGSSSITTYNGYSVPYLFMLNENGTLIDCELVPVTATPTTTATPTNTPTTSPTMTPTCGTFTTQYLETTQQGTSDIRFTLYDNPNYTGNANAICDYQFDGTYDIVNGSVGQIFTNIMASGDHNDTFNTGSNISGFTINSFSAACGCVNVIFNQTTPTPTPTMTNTPTNSVTPTMTNTTTQTPSQTQTQTPSPTSSCPNTIYTHGALITTCSDYCNNNYLIQTTNCSSEPYGTLSIGDFIYGYSGQTGYLAFSNVYTDTNTGPFRIADLDGSGEILGIYVCSGGSCVPL